VFAKLEPLKYGRDNNHRPIIGHPFFIAGGNPPTLFEAIKCSLNSISFTVDGGIEGTRAAFIALAWDGIAYAAPPQPRPKQASSIAFIGRHPFGTAARATAPRTLDRSPEQRIGDRHLVLLAWGQDDRDDAAGSVGAEMDFGAESALGIAERFGRWVPFFAPAAC
jgi:hypothetical protein